MGGFYRVSHLLLDLGWVDFDLGVKVTPSFPIAKFSLAQAELGRQWNTKNQNQPNPRQMGHPVVCINISNTDCLV